MAPGEAGLEIRLLGPVELTRDGSVIPLAGRQRAVLAILAARRGRRVSVTELVDNLWADAPTPSAEPSLRTYVSRLRTALEPEAGIDYLAGGYAIRASAAQVDADRFEELTQLGSEALSRGNPRRASAVLREALALWRSAPFADIGEVPLLESERARLDELHARALELRLDADLARGESAALIPELQSLTRAYPYREHLWAQLMLALYRAGRQADALATYHAARARLDEELAVEPGPELRALEAAILRHDVPDAKPAGPGYVLPHEISTFIGRARELEELGSLVTRHRLVTMTGVGGTGKTRLALEVARRVATETADGAVFVDLASVMDPAEVEGQVARALGLADAVEGSRSARIADVLRGSDVLIVLDNCEHVRDAAASVAAAILASAGWVRIIATSRAVLGVPGEVLYPVDPLGLDATASEDGQPADAVALLLARVREARSAFVPDDEALAAAARICRVLDGLPLAIELAAARSRVLALPDIARRLDDRFRFLVSWRALTPARHRTLREAMDWSYELLAGDEQTFLRQAGVFVGGFTLAAAAAVCVEGDEGTALALVERLLDASLLGATDDAGSRRFRMLETIREYAAERSDGGERARVESQHARFYLDLAEDRRQEVESQGQLTALRDLIIEDANLRSALAHLAADAEGADRELRFCAALWRYWWLHGQLADGSAFIRHALARASGFPPSTWHVEALRGASSLALRQGQVGEAIFHAEEAIAIGRQVSPVDLARAEVSLGNAVGSAGDHARAAQLYASATEAFRGAGMRWDLSIALLNTADNAFLRGDLEGVERAANESLVLARETGDDAGIAVNLGNLAFAALEQGRLERAEALLREALERSAAIGFKEWIAIMLGGLGAVAAARDLDGRAIALVGAARRLRREIGAELDSVERNVHERTMDALIARIGRDALDAAMASAESVPTAAAVRLALFDTDGAGPAPRPDPPATG